MQYRDILPIGTALIISATSFGLGLIYSNLPYDVHTLWRLDETGEHFQQSLNHYSVWANAPYFVYHVLHFVIFVGLVGCFIKLYKPNPDVKYFEYGTLVMYMLGIVIYLSNMRIGINSCITGEWGDVDMHTGINVMAASQFIIVFALVGVLLLQGGLYYATWYDAKLKKEFFENERKKVDAAKGKASITEEGESQELQDISSKSTGASTSKGTSKGLAKQTSKGSSKTKKKSK